jgi:hypothetical protein
MQRQDMYAFLHRRLAWILGGLGASLWLLGGVAGAAWTVQRLAEAAGGCYLQSDTKAVSDGYQDTHATMLVQHEAVLVQTAAPLDVSFADIGMQVDKQALIPMDTLSERKTARFTTSYTTLIEQFKRGYSVRVQLRFWPTWPATGPHEVTFSLLGFTKAYTDMQACTP